MLRINFPILDEAITIEGATILAIRDTKVYAKLIKELYQYEGEGEVKLYDSDFKSLKPSELMVITDIMGYEVNTPTMLKKIHMDLEGQFNNKIEIKLEIERLSSLITQSIVSECLENELDLVYDEISLLALIKALGVRVDSQNVSLFEKIFEILQIFKYLTTKKLLVFINSLSYFQTEEIKSILEYIQLGQLPVLFLESDSPKEAPHYLLDDDFYLDRNYLM